MTTQEWRDYLKVIYHPLLNNSFAQQQRYEKNFRDMHIQLSKRQTILVKLTALLLDQSANQSVSSYEKMMAFIELVAKRGKELHRESQNYQANLQVEMTDASI